MPAIDPITNTIEKKLLSMARFLKRSTRLSAQLFNRSRIFREDLEVKQPESRISLAERACERSLTPHLGSQTDAAGACLRTLRSAMGESLLPATDRIFHEKCARRAETAALALCLVSAALRYAGGVKISTQGAAQRNPG